MDEAGVRSTAATWRRLAVAAALLVILVGAAATRFVDLETNPGGLYPDEAAEALSALRIISEPGYRPVLLVDNGGREALWAYVVAGAFLLGGATPLVLHSVAAIVGVLSVLAIWLLGRRFGAGAGLAAAAWAAGALWLVSLSRVGFRTTLVPLLAALALLAMVTWFERPSRRAALLAGGAVALAALYTYQPMRLLPIIVVLWLGTIRATDPIASRRLRPSLPLAALAFLIVASPMIVTAIADPQIYLGRSIGVTPFNPSLDAEDPITHTLRTLGMFGLTGDPNARHNVGGLPLIGWPLTLIVGFGVIAMWRGQNRARDALILWSLVVLLVPPIIATEGQSPHFLRSVGLAAPLAVTIGVGSAAIVEWLSAHGIGRRRPMRTAGIAMVTLAFAAMAVHTGATYLSRPVIERYDAFTYELVSVTEFARGGTDVAIADEFSAMTVRFLAGPNPPRIVSPGTPIDVTSVDRVVARTIEELSAGVGDELSRRARPVAWDPLGRATVWVVDLD